MWKLFTSGTAFDVSGDLQSMQSLQRPPQWQAHAIQVRSSRQQCGPDMHLCLDRLDLPSRLLCLSRAFLASSCPEEISKNLQPWPWGKPPVSTAKRSSRAKLESREAFPVRDLCHQNKADPLTGSDNSQQPPTVLACPACERTEPPRATPGFASTRSSPCDCATRRRREHSQLPAPLPCLDPGHGRLPQNVQRCRLALL